MTNKEEKAAPRDKVFHQISDDPRVEVLHFSKHSCAVEPCSFHASRIDRLEGAGEGKSTIILLSGISITVALPYKELVAKIDAGTSPVDLTPYCDANGYAGAEIGDKMADGAIYLGLSPDTKTPMCAKLLQENSPLTFSQVRELAEDRSKGTDFTYRVPSLRELKMVFNNAAAVGCSGDDWYWTSTRYENANQMMVANFGHGSPRDTYTPVTSARRGVLLVRD